MNFIYLKVIAGTKQSLDNALPGGWMSASTQNVPRNEFIICANINIYI